MTDSGRMKGSDAPIGRKVAPDGDALAGAGERQLLRPRVRRKISGQTATADGQGRRSTKAKLMDVAEILIARHGVDGVSLRDIGLLAGQANSNVIQYHFANKIGLVFAILDDRNSKRESMRRDMFDELKKNDDLNNPRKLLEILWVPSLNFISPDGNHIYCHFLMQCRLHPEFSKRKRHEDRNATAIIVEAISQLRRIYGDISDEVFRLRLAALTRMFISSVVEHDKAREVNPHAGEFDLGPYLDIAIAALAAPASA
jgi:AcrR family transcriptional regulator